jgi:hypothetical protein
VLFAGLEEDAVTRSNDLDRAAAALCEADALGDVDGLAVRVVCHAVRAPGVKRTLLALRREGPDGVAIEST